MPAYYRPEQFADLHFDGPLTAEAERALIRRWQDNGDEAARTELVERFALFTSKLAFRFAGPTGRHPDRVDDCIGVANVALVEALDKFDLSRDGARFTSLLYLLVRRHVVKFVLREAREERPSTDTEDVPEQAAPDEAIADDSGVADRVLALLPKLPPDERTVITAIFFERQRPTDIRLLFSPVKTLVDVVRLKASALARLRRLVA